MVHRTGPGADAPVPSERKDDSGMAEIRPFRALRFSPKAGKIEELTCPPYDIISESQRRGYLARNPHNIIRLELPRDGGDPYAEAGDTLKRWRDEGILKRDGREAIYVYEIEFTADGKRRRIRGLTCLVKLEEFEKGIILPHEETLSRAKADRFRLMKATDCNFSNIYSLYMDPCREKAPDIQTLTEKTQPLNEMTDEAGLIHRLWAITDQKEIAAIQEHLKDAKLFIADGHHRYETALNYRNDLRARGASVGTAADYVMMTLVEMDDPGLVVFPTHRMIREVAGFDAEALLRECGAWFEVRRGIALPALEETLNRAYRDGRSAFVFYAGGTACTLLTLKDASVMDALLPGKSPASRRLDVAVLHTLILERLLGMGKEDMANQMNLAYTRDVKEALGGVDRGDCQCSFLMNPTRVSEIRDVASAGEKMPQKSTYFYPKLITGLTMNDLGSF